MYIAIDCSVAFKKIIKNYKYLTKLHINSMLGSLFTNEAITLDEKIKMQSMQLEMDRMTHFLDNILLRSLQVDQKEKYIGFLKVLKDSEDSDIRYWYVS